MNKETQKGKELLNVSQFRIGIIGPMGVGKSELAKILSSHWNMPIIDEEFEENPFLPDFYKELGKDSFQSQIWFSIATVRRLAKYSNENIALVDNDMEGNICFAIAQKEMGWMNNDELNLLMRNYQTLLDRYDAKESDVIIYLVANESTLDKRIARRKRQIESNFDNEEDLIKFREYLTVLYKTFEEWAVSNKNKNIVKVSTENNNYIKDQEKQDDIVLHLENEIRKIYPGFLLE